MKADDPIALEYGMLVAESAMDKVQHQWVPRDFVEIRALMVDLLAVAFAAGYSHCEWRAKK